MGVYSRQEPEAIWNCRRRSLEEWDDRKVIAGRLPDDHMEIQKTNTSWQQNCVSWPHKGMWITSAWAALSVFPEVYAVYKGPLHWNMFFLFLCHLKMSYLDCSNSHLCRISPKNLSIFLTFLYWTGGMSVHLPTIWIQKCPRELDLIHQSSKANHRQRNLKLPAGNVLAITSYKLTS